MGAAAGLAGCTFAGRTFGGARPTDGTVVQFVADSGAKGAQADINKALHEAGLPSDVSVEILAVSSDTAQQQYSQWLSAGLEQPSLFRMDSGWTIPFILREQVVNLSEDMPDLASRVKENYFEASVQTASGPDGDVYGVPLFTDFGLTLYRKDLVRKAGFDPSGWATNPLTWKRFAEVTKRTMEQSDTTYGYVTQAQVYEGLPCCTFTEWMASRGGSYFGARGNLLDSVGERPVTVDTDPVVDAARMVRAFLHGPDDEHALDGIPGPISPQAILQWSETPSLAAFTNGDAVTHRNWPYSVLSAGAKEVFGENLGVMPMPYGVKPGEAKYEGMGGSVSALGGWHVTLNPNAKHPKAARQVLRALNKDSFYIALMNVLGYVPPKPDLLDSKRARNVDVMGRYVDTLKYAGQHAVPRPATVVWPMQSPRIAQQVSATLTGEKAPRAAMSDLKRLLVRIENAATQDQS
jgi:ABC-type glycerol-3-phosphate transport system substrate-binding protein